MISLGQMWDLIRSVSVHFDKPDIPGSDLSSPVDAALPWPNNETSVIPPPSPRTRRCRPALPPVVTCPWRCPLAPAAPHSDRVVWWLRLNSPLCRLCPSLCLTRSWECCRTAWSAGDKTYSKMSKVSSLSHPPLNWHFIVKNLIQTRLFFFNCLNFSFFSEME